MIIVIFVLPGVVLMRFPHVIVIFSYADSCRKNHNDTMIKDEGRLL